MWFRLFLLIILAASSVNWTGLAQAQGQPQAAAAVSPARGVAPPTTTRPPFGIAVKRPVFAGACRACPWGVLAAVTAEAMKPLGYDVQICWVCWSNFGPREMGDKTVPVLPNIPYGPDSNGAGAYAETPPNAVPDVSATGLWNLVAAWNGTGAYSQDKKKRQNYRGVAIVQQPNYLVIAVNKKSGITDLAQIKTRTTPTWIVGEDAIILGHYGITEELLKAHGGGFVTGSDRLKRASADVFIGGGLLVNTPEQRMWYEVTQLADLQFLDIPAPVIEKYLEQVGYQRGTLPLAILRGVDRPIPTVVRQAHIIYVRDETPDQFAYDIAKSLDEHQELFRLTSDPYYYDPRLVANSSPIPMHPGALKYYRERGYIK